jgi:hypothetical protein
MKTQTAALVAQLLTYYERYHTTLNELKAYDTVPQPSRGRRVKVASISIGGGGVSNFTTALAYLKAAGRAGSLPLFRWKLLQIEV